MDTVNFAPMVSGGMAVFAAMIYAEPVIYELRALEPCYMYRYGASNRLRLILQFIDAPAPRGRTVIVGGPSTTITSGY